MTQESEKSCTQCGQVKMFSEFSKASASKSGLHSFCKECSCKKAAEWRAQNPEKLKRQHQEQYARRKASGYHDAYMTAYRIKHRVRLLADARERVKRWNAANPGRPALWKVANADHVRAYAKAFYHRNIVHQRKWAREYSAKNREKMREKNRCSYVKNPELYKGKTAKRRVMMITAKTADAVDYKAILERDGLFCYLCERPITDGKIHYDHVAPLVHGGAHSPENIKVTHAFCNLSKHDKSVEEWRAVNGIL